MGGFRADRLGRIAGVLRGETESVARNSAMPTVPSSALRKWATEQAELLASAQIPDEYKLEAGSLVMLLGGNISDLPIAIRNREYLTLSAVETLLQELNAVEVYEGSEIEYDEEDDVRPKAFKNDFEVSETLFLVPGRALTSILEIGKQHWPECVPELYVEGLPRSCGDAFEDALKRAWGREPESDEDSRCVGKVDDEGIWRKVTVYSRTANVSGSDEDSTSTA